MDEEDEPSEQTHVTESQNSSKPSITSPEVHSLNQKKYEELGNQPPIEAENPKDLDTSVDLIDYDSEELHAPNPSTFTGEKETSRLKKLHVLGDLHGWAPGLITYLITHKLASININGMLLGSEGIVDERAINNLFGRDSSMDSSNRPSAGLKGRPLYNDCVNGIGHYSVRVRWTGDKSVGFVQLGDVVDRSDHSELACEILRQLLIDAPGNVFVLLGNHEQFLLENEYDNWHLNEVRNAVIDGRHGVKKWAKKHLRFLGTIEQDEVARSKSVFRSYKDSAELLYLTQAAVQQKGLGLEHGLDDSDIELILQDGWKPYEVVQSLSKKYAKKGQSFPGAITSLVIGENLFHHAEPSQQMSGLVSEMQWNKQLGWINYIHGGNNLQNSPHSYLLWSRGSSTGAASNRPASEAAIEQISIHWPGLYNIVHGHTPTVTLPEFEHISGGRSVPVSYLAESSNSTPKYGKASHVRIFNIDEGMAPIYYSGKEDPDDPLRLPVGLRLTSKRQRLDSVVAHSTNDEIFELERDRTVRTDTRKLWRWQEGTLRTNNDSTWKAVSKERWQKTISHKGITYLVEVSSHGKAFLNRSISGFLILENLLVYLLDDAKCKPKQMIRKPPNKALKHVHVDDGDRALAHMLHLGDSWKTAEKIDLTMIGIHPGMQRNTSEVFAINSTRNGRSFFLHHRDIESAQTKISSYSVNKFIIEHGVDPFCISLSGKDLLKEKLKHWLGEISFNSKIDAKIPMCIGTFPVETNSQRDNHSKIAKFGTRQWKYPKPKPQASPSSPKSKTPSSSSRDIRDVDVQKPSAVKRDPPMPKPPVQDIRNAAKIQPKPHDMHVSDPAQAKETAGHDKRLGQGKENSVPDVRDEKKSAKSGSPNLSATSQSEKPQQSNPPSSALGSIGSVEKGIGGELIITISPDDLKTFFKNSTNARFQAKLEITFHPKYQIISIKVNHTGNEDDSFNFSTDRQKLMAQCQINGKPTVTSKRHGINQNFLIEFLESEILNNMLKKCKEEWPDAPNW
jgi:hypothetical protein